MVRPAQPSAGAGSPETATPGGNPLQMLLNEAQRHRQAGLWAIAEVQYAKVLAAVGDTTDLALKSALLQNRAICLFALRQHANAMADAQAAFAINPALWQSGILTASCSKVLESPARYAQRVMELYVAHPDQPQISMMYAQVLLNQLGDAAKARVHSAALIEHPAHAREAHLLQLMSRLYDRDEGDSAEALTADLVRFADEWLQLSDAELAAVNDMQDAQVPARVPGRRRIGVLSSLLQSSPVHALGISRLRQWHEEGAELFFFQRGLRSDWATEEFRQIAAHWVEVSGLEAARLHHVLRSCELDVLYEMGGWMDVEGLRAVSVKPCPELYKWVGGQSCTTGLRSFDGFVSDAVQSPPDTAHLYTEPLLIEAGSYVRYAPPPYLRAFQNAARAQHNSRWGVISNPVKLSRAFLAWLASVGEGKSSLVSRRRGVAAHVAQLVLADYRYALQPVRERIEAALRPAWGDRLVFATPEGHHGFIELLASLEGLVDTFPYSCGLTMVEGLYVGLDVCFPPFERQLFCERHGLAHVVNHEAAVASAVADREH